MKKIILFAVFSIASSIGALSFAADVKVSHELKPGQPSLVHAEGSIHSSPEEAWENMIRFNDYKNFMPRVVDSFFISPEGIAAIQNAGTRNANRLRHIAAPYKIDAARKSGGLWGGYVFMVIDTPFPVENRWYVLKVEQDERQRAQHVYKRCWELVDGNIEAAQGCWQIAPGADPGHARLTYNDQVNPGGKVPDWISRMGATQTVPQMFDSLEKVASR